MSIPDLGFAILPTYYKKGFTFEASNAVLSFAKNSLDYSQIAAITLKTNNASINLLKKLDFKMDSIYIDEVSKQNLQCYKYNL